ncbi:PBP1A family penicillin-binding protein [Desulfohalobiaceae bacterium Ax17]|uniref:penicillin-binding protein 1A n=1 Tax=Desulfovulcanus ferrireducens TaxID=2831190 RepID=UPI00207BB682|nr:PBP1A family penicillin-binding protein [Desulfovulcanus ferrireducens]MBT8763483.1 PBP1A family penicillin-binding protein [Desulfovulcanus ferrireducens]
MKVLKNLLIVLLLLLILITGSGIGLYFWAAKDLPGFKKITDYNPPLVTKILTRNGRILGYFYKEKRFLVSLNEISEWVPKAFLAAEDANFYQHEGIDFLGIFRAAIKNLMAGGIVQGGSTITQQVIKSMLLSPERSYTRKLKEAILAYRLEKYLTKDEILTIYLNQIYMGAGAYGIEAAAREYFGKHASELNLAEAALLAGLPKAPSRYNPYKNFNSAKKRQEYVLNRLKELNWINDEEYNQARQTQITLKQMPDPSWQQGAYYLEEVRRWLIEKFGQNKVYTGGLVVYTAGDLEHLVAAENALKKGLIASTKRRGWQGPIEHLEANQFDHFLSQESVHPDILAPGEWIKVLVTRVDKKGAEVKFGPFQGWIDVKTMGWARTPDPKKAPEEVPKIKDARQVLTPGDVVWASIINQKENSSLWNLSLEQEPRVEGALVSLEPATGEVLALVGGYNFFKSQFNRATQARRQPGSAFKPIVYSAAMDNGFTPASIVLDAPIVYEDLQTNSTWKPENFEGIFYGPTLLRTALVKSRNLVTIRIAQRIGIDKIIQRAKDLGLKGEFPRDLSVSLGSVPVTLINLCQAYTAFARGGTYIQPHLINKVTTSWGEELYQAKYEPVKALSPETSYIITYLLQEVVRDGTGWRARVLKRPVAGKTGTSNNEQDAWFMGFTPYLLTGVYVGFDQLTPMGKYETGSRAASPIWVNYRLAVEPNYPIQDFPRPPGIVMAKIDAQTGLLAGPNSDKVYLLPFKEGTEPTSTSDSSSPKQESQKASEDILKQLF